MEGVGAFASEEDVADVVLVCGAEGEVGVLGGGAGYCGEGQADVELGPLVGEAADDDFAGEEGGVLRGVDGGAEDDALDGGFDGGLELRGPRGGGFWRRRE